MNNSFVIYGSGNAREHSTFLALCKTLSPSKNLFFLFYGENALLQEAPGVLKVNNTQDAISHLREIPNPLVLVLSPLDILRQVPREFKKEGVSVFSVDEKLANLEGSKIFAKNLMVNSGIPTPKFFIFNDYLKAKEFIEKEWIDKDREFVIKSNRFLANASLRVSVPEDKEEAIETLYKLMVKNTLQEASGYVLVEEKISGPELSIHLFVDGSDYQLMPFTQDYKPLFEDNQGPNTDGIGSVSSTYLDNQTEKIGNQIENEIVKPTLQAIYNLGGRYQFVLYIGVMLTKDGPKALEYNVRPGNPEWSTLMPLLETPLEDIINAILENRLNNLQIKWFKNKVSTTIMTTAVGYPFETKRNYNEVIKGLDGIDENVNVVGENLRKEKEIHVNGGRVLGLTTTGANCEEVRDKLYRNISKLHYKGIFYRDDIGINGIVL